MTGSCAPSFWNPSRSMASKPSRSTTPAISTAATPTPSICGAGYRRLRRSRDPDEDRHALLGLAEREQLVGGIIVEPAGRGDVRQAKRDDLLGHRFRRRQRHRVL